MATATIVLNDDADFDTGRFSTAWTVDDSKVSEGFMTAAELTARYLTHLIKQPGFAQQVVDFGQTIAALPLELINTPEKRPGTIQDAIAA